MAGLSVLDLAPDRHVLRVLVAGAVARKDLGVLAGGPLLEPCEKQARGAGASDVVVASPTSPPPMVMSQLATNQRWSAIQ
jgi:hypothetical protein